TIVLVGSRRVVRGSAAAKKQSPPQRFYANWMPQVVSTWEVLPWSNLRWGLTDSMPICRDLSTHGGTTGCLADLQADRALLSRDAWFTPLLDQTPAVPCAAPLQQMA